MLTGEFTSIHGVQWKVQIIGTDLTGNLVLPADSPLTFEWDTKSKENVICGSVATLKVESQSDRQFISLYTESVGSVRMDVYRNDSLWWSGCLDPEFYEEPYSRNRYYDVTLTFSDFGQLNRLAYNLDGRQLVSTILSDAITRLGLNEDIALDTQYITTKFTNGTTITPSNLMIDSANFYDEESEASKLDEVIDGLFQPLGIKMMQRNGKIYLFDINGIASSLPQEQVYWDGTDSQLGVDKVYNNVKITFSPYVQSTLIEDNFDVSVDTSSIGTEGNNVHTYYKGYHYDENDEYDQMKEGDKDFSIFTNPTFSNIINVSDYPLSIRKIYGGEDLDVIGIIYDITKSNNTGGADISNRTHSGYTIWRKSNGWSSSQNGVGFKTKQVRFSKSSDNALLRLTLPVFYDARYNPWRTESVTNFEANYNTAKEHISQLNVCFRMRLYDADKTTVLYHYNNYRQGSTTYLTNTFDDMGEWVSGDYSGSDHCLLFYWNRGNIGTSFIGTWTDNSHAGGNSSFTKLDPLIESAPAGQYIVLPPVSGFIEIEVLNGQEFLHRKSESEFYNETEYDTSDINKIGWFMYKAPLLELVNNYSPYDVVEHDDIEYSGVLDKNAADDLSLDTTCGTSATNIPTARGCLLDTDGEEIHSLVRNGVTDVAEHLLIGTLFSAYGKRHTKLTGTARIQPDFVNYTDANTSETLMALGENMDVRTDDTNITLVEVNEDSYHGVIE